MTKRYILIFYSLVQLSILTSYAQHLDNWESKSKGEYYASDKLITYAVPDDFPLEGKSLYSIKINGKYTGVYNDINAWDNLVSFGYFDFNPESEVEVEIESTNNFKDYEILPQNNAIKSKRTGNKITFNVKRADCAITIVFDNHYQGNTLHIFPNSIDKEAPNPDNQEYIYFDKGYHDLKGTFSITGNQKIYIAGGAVLNGTIKIEGGTGAYIHGRGMLMRKEKKDVVLGSSFTDSLNIDGILIHNHRSQDWTVAMHAVSNLRISNVKVISTRYASTDGFDIVNSNNIHFDNIFVRACDDAIVIKGLIPGNPANCPPNENMLFENIQIWNDCNNAMCLGAETHAAYYKNITFRNIDVLYSYDDRDHHSKLDERSVMTIVCLQGTFFSDITYENIRINKCQRLICLTFKDNFWFGSILGDQSTPGGINNIHYKNIFNYSKNTGPIANEILMNGWYKKGTPTKYIENIIFENLKIEEKKITTKDNPYIKTNNTATKTLVKNIRFE